MPCTNGGGPSRLQSTRRVAAVAELGSLVEEAPMNAQLALTGGCYCARSATMRRSPLMRGLCYADVPAISSAPAIFSWRLTRGIQFTKGTPRSFKTKNDRPGSPTRHFCEACGVHLTASSERAADGCAHQVGTLDTPCV